MDGLIDQQRLHLRAKKRSVRREQRLDDLSSIAIFNRLVSRGPCEAAQRKEQTERIRLILRTLSPIDQEILELRYVEELTNQEASEVLHLEPQRLERGTAEPFSGSMRNSTNPASSRNCNFRHENGQGAIDGQSPVEY